MTPTWFREKPWLLLCNKTKQLDKQNGRFVIHKVCSLPGSKAELKLSLNAIFVEGRSAASFMTLW